MHTPPPIGCASLYIVVGRVSIRGPRVPFPGLPSHFYTPQAQNQQSDDKKKREKEKKGKWGPRSRLLTGISRDPVFRFFVQYLNPNGRVGARDVLVGDTTTIDPLGCGLVHIGKYYSTRAQPGIIKHFAKVRNADRRERASWWPILAKDVDISAVCRSGSAASGQATQALRVLGRFHS